MNYQRSTKDQGGNVAVQHPLKQFPSITYEGNNSSARKELEFLDIFNLQSKK